MLFHVANTTPSNYLKEHDKEQDPAGDVDLEPEQHHGDPAELPEEIEDHEEGGQEPAASPRDVHVLALFAPLDPHPDAVLEEGGDEAEPGQMGQDVLCVAGDLEI